MSIPPAISFPNSPGWSRWIERLRTATAGRFTILRELGRGGFAAVFLAQQHQPNRRVAIKLLLPTHLESEWALEHFRGESQKIAQWRHQSVVTIYEVHEEQDLFYFVMSYVEGASLHEILQAAGPLPVPVVKSVLAQTGSALWYAHRQGVTHRDVKPQNVLIDIDGGAVVADFGIAKQAGGTSHTVTGMIFGTAPYMAPEQCETGATSTQSDQYSLGIVVYEMLTGAPPFTGPATAVLVAHLQKEVPLLRTVRPDCPPELEAAVARMLSKKPEDRFPTIAEAIQASGAIELPEFDANRQAFANAARQLAARQQAQVLDIVSIPPQIEVGDHIPVQATLRSNSGDSMDTSGAKWSVDNANVAEIDPEKKSLQAREPGFTTLFVKSGGLEKQIRVEVVAPRPHAIEITAPQQPVAVGERVRLLARALSKNGLPVDGSIQWLVDDPAIAMITPDGTLQTRAPGRARVRAQLGTITGEVIVDVALPAVAEVRITGLGASMQTGERRQAAAVVLGAGGQTIGDRVITWMSSDPHIATVSASGIVTAHQTGAVTISASCEQVDARVMLEIAAAQAATVEIQGPAIARVGDEFTLRAIVRDAMGRALERDVSWTSDEPAVATVSDTGVVQAIAAGSAILSASVDGVSAATLLDVAARGVSGTTTHMRRAGTPAATELFSAGAVGAAIAASQDVGGVATEAPPAVRARAADKPKSRAAMFAGVGVVAIAAVAAAVILIPRGDSATGTEPVAATTPGAGDSVQTVAASDSAATSADAPVVVPTPATDAPARATVPAAAGRPATAGPAPTRPAVGESGAVASNTVTPPVTSAAETPPVVAPPVNPVPTPPVAASNANADAERETQLRDQARHVINQYAKALESGQIANVLKVFPSMDKRTQDGWNVLFRNVRDLDVNMRATGPITITGTGGNAVVSGEYLYVNTSNRKRCRQEVMLFMNFEKLDGTGQIAGARQESSKVSDC